MPSRVDRHPLLRALLCALALGLSVSAPMAAAAPPLAEVNGEAITAEEVERALATQLGRLQEQIYALKRQKLEALIADRLLAREAARRGLSVQALLDAEVGPRVEPVTEQEVEAAYQANKARLRGGEATAREQIRAQLRNQKLLAQREAFVRSLRAQASVVVHLTPPPVARTDVVVDGAPFKGPAAAPVTIVKFEDFQCSFCKRVQATLAELQTRYAETLRLVHRDFPIDTLHPQARRAHEAARCAHDQGKFWAYHDLLYAKAPNASPADLAAYAREVGLDLPAFDTCLRRGIHQAAVERDVAEGLRAGVTGTPTFFVNGRPVTGAQSLETFVRLVEEELAQPR